MANHLKRLEKLEKELKPAPNQVRYITLISCAWNYESYICQQTDCETGKTRYFKAHAVPYIDFDERTIAHDSPEHQAALDAAEISLEEWRAQVAEDSVLPGESMPGDRDLGDSGCPYSASRLMSVLRSLVVHDSS